MQTDPSRVQADLGRIVPDLPSMVPDLSKMLAGPVGSSNLVHLALGTPTLKASQAIGLSRFSSAAAALAGFDRGVAEAALGVHFQIRGLTAALAQAASGFSPATSLAAAEAFSRINKPGLGIASIVGVQDQWRSALMRWSPPPISELVSANVGELARAVSQIAYPRVSLAAYIALDRLLVYPAITMPPIAWTPKVELPPIGRV